MLSKEYKNLKHGSKKIKTQNQYNQQLTLVRNLINKAKAKKEEEEEKAVIFSVDCTRNLPLGKMKESSKSMLTWKYPYSQGILQKFGNKFLTKKFLHQCVCIGIYY